MGCNSSRPTSDISGPIESTKSNKPYHTKTHGQTRMSKTETKINQALLKKKLEHAVEDKPLTFERLLLKFDKIRNVVGYVKNVFNQVATEGKLDNTGLEMCMKRLGVKMSLEDILDLFDFIDVQAQSVITIKEFLVALTIGMVLEVIPALSKPTTEGKPLIKRSFSGFLGHQSEIKEMLNLIVSAYLIFDPQAKGYIERQNVTTMLDEQEGRNKKGSNVILSEQRWKEMVFLFISILLFY
jgi:Ca2+-binding EF-hand superfamily protein